MPQSREEFLPASVRHDRKSSPHDLGGSANQRFSPDSHQGSDLDRGAGDLPHVAAGKIAMCSGFMCVTFRAQRRFCASLAHDYRAEHLWATTGYLAKGEGVDMHFF